MVKFRSFLAAALTAAAAVAQETSTFTDPSTGISFQRFVSEKDQYSFGITTPVEATDEFIGQLVGPVTGWAGVSLLGQMRNSLLITAWAGDDSSVVTGFRYATAYRLPEVFSQPGPVLTQIPCGTSVNETHFTVTFVCKNCNSWTAANGNVGGFLLNTDFTIFGYATSKNPVEDPSDPGSAFGMHTGFGLYAAILAEARSEGYEKLKSCGGDGGGDGGTVTRTPIVEPPVSTRVPSVDPPVVTRTPIVEPPVSTRVPTLDPPVVTRTPDVDSPVTTREPSVELPASSAVEVSSSVVVVDPTSSAPAPSSTPDPDECDDDDDDEDDDEGDDECSGNASSSALPSSPQPTPTVITDPPPIFQDPTPTDSTRPVSTRSIISPSLPTRTSLSPPKPTRTVIIGPGTPSDDPAPSQPSQQPGEPSVTRSVIITPTDVPSQPLAERWAQCGGITYKGPTKCREPYKCVKFNDYYSQCL